LEMFLSLNSAEDIGKAGIVSRVVVAEGR